jgi:hypothetical protein
LETLASSWFTCLGSGVATNQCPKSDDHFVLEFSWIARGWFPRQWVI